MSEITIVSTDNDLIVIDVQIPVNEEITTQRIVIPLESVNNRMDFYGCTTEEEAIKCIVGEHKARLNCEQLIPPKPWRSLTRKERKQYTGAGNIELDISKFSLPSNIKIKLQEMRTITYEEVESGATSKSLSVR